MYMRTNVCEICVNNTVYLLTENLKVFVKESKHNRLRSIDIFGRYVNDKLKKTEVKTRIIIMAKEIFNVKEIYFTVVRI